LPDVGTAFALRGSNTACTARHNLEGKKAITFQDNSGTKLNPRKIWYHQNDLVDLAFVEFDSQFPGDVGVLFNFPKVTESAMVMGYPPVPGFDSVLIAEQGEVSTELKSAAGEITGSETSYLNGQKYFLLNARVKGGSSGAPVFDERGFVIGMISDMAISPKQSTQLDGFGYSLALPGQLIQEAFGSLLTKGSQLREVRFTNADSGRISTAQS
jgi:S1-C subfamily serine protease